jgi:thioredoxin
MSKLTTITDADFEQQVLLSDLPVVVDFGAPWCPPCRAVAPILGDLAVEFAGRLRIVSVNTDESPGLAERYAITGLPTMIFFQQGTEVQRVRGAATKRVLKDTFDSAIPR